MYVCLYMYMYVYICMFMFMYVCLYMYMYMYVYICICFHIYMLNIYISAIYKLYINLRTMKKSFRFMCTRFGLVRNKVIFIYLIP